MTAPLTKRLTDEADYALSLIPGTVGQRREYLQQRADLLREAATELRALGEMIPFSVQPKGTHRIVFYDAEENVLGGISKGRPLSPSATVEG
jgi:hypothetical protein